MFLYCGTNGASTGGGGGTIVTNNLYAAGLPNTWRPNFPNHGEISGDPYTIVDERIRLNSYPGTLTLTFFETVIFRSATLDSPSGTNTAVLNSPSKTIPFSGTTASGADRCLSITFHLAGGDLESVFFESPFFYQRKVFTDIDFFRTFNAVSNGSYLVPSGGAITIEFPEPTIIFSAETTGLARYFFGATEVFRTTTQEAYPNPITSLRFDIDLRALTYFCPSQSLQNGYDEETVIFADYANGYPNPAHRAFTSVGVTSPNFSGTLTFREPTIVLQIIATSLSINGSPRDPPSFTHPTKISSITCTNLSYIRFYQAIPREQRHTFESRDFTQFSIGETNIATPDYAVSGGMISLSNTLICSADGLSKSPLFGPGTLTFSFTHEILFRSITLAAGSGTLSINSSTYELAPGIEIFANDWVSGGEYCKTFSVALDGEIASFRAQFLPATEYTPATTVNENFDTLAWEFSVTTFDTNIANEYGSPNVAFAGPGIGGGGGPGPGENNSYLGRATLDPIIFPQPTWVESISFINTVLGSTIALDGNPPEQLPIYGLNSLYTLSVKKKITSIVPSLTAIYRIIYEAPLRQIIGLPDNAPTRVQISPDLFGSKYFKILSKGGASSNILASPGSLYVQASPAPTAESVYGEWNIGDTPKIYHGVLKTGGTGALIYYAVYEI